MLLLMLVVNPYMFGYKTIHDANTLILMVFLTSVLIPSIAILVMKGIGWIHSLNMPHKHERIGPYLVSGVLYLSLYLHLSKTKAFPDLLLISTLGSVIALFFGFFINNFRKISMHAIAVGGLLAFACLLFLSNSTSQFALSFQQFDLRIPTIYIVYLSLVITGLVCTARLILGAHDRLEVYSGVIVGMMSILIGAFFVR